ncbi:hypothetical protein [Parafrankia sp. BMG5.11]|uniref:hypothetical protein n=1 Tax=Parafrankia sp. BMG5.11 TaxID=222540 RepID=UPI00103BD142|nr:hypothetical protein [Parafrankia sp. BMG5.11]TCJ30965.1 hypothetical protein E0504_49525 [Parafrankia sp. BMG5.11]
MDGSSNTQDLRTISALARVGGRSERVTVSDLTLNCCRVVTSFGFVSPGDAITLTIGNMRIYADVNWQDLREAKISFRTKLHPAIINHLGFSVQEPERRERTLAERLKRSAPDRSCSAVLSGAKEVAAFFDRSRSPLIGS